MMPSDRKCKKFCYLALANVTTTPMHASLRRPHSTSRAKLGFDRAETGGNQHIRQMITAKLQLCSARKISEHLPFATGSPLAFWLINRAILKRATACSHWERTIQHLDGVRKDPLSVLTGKPGAACVPWDQPESLLWHGCSPRAPQISGKAGTGKMLTISPMSSTCSPSLPSGDSLLAQGKKPPCLVGGRMKPYLSVRRGLTKLYVVMTYQESSSCFFPERSWKSWNCQNILLSLAKQILLHQIKTQLHSLTLTQGYA